MSEIVERMALALFNHDMSRFTTQQRVEWTEEDLMPEHGTADIYRGRVRVAIEAMREPTDAMAKAGSNTIDEKMPDAKALRQVLYIWADMIDEALK